MCGSGARRAAGDVVQATRRSLLARFVMPLALLQGACSLVPQYTRPDPSVPPAWSGASSQGLKNATAVRSGWWRSFGSTELSTLVERSLATNYSLQATITRIDEARGTARIAGAPLYPALSLNGTLDRSNGQGTSLQTSRTQNAFGLATYEIDFWGKNRATAESAKALAAASAFDSDAVAMTLTASVADTYLQILSLQERIRLAKTIAHDAERVLSLIEARRSVGTATDIDVEQQRNAVATFDSAVPILQQQLEQSLHALAILVGGIPEGFDVAAHSLDNLAIPQVQANLPSVVLRQRPDIRAAEARLVAANFSVGAARAAFYPSLNLTAAGGIASPSLSHFFPLAQGLSDVGGTLLQPLFSGGLLEGQLQLNRAQVVELTATYRQTCIAALQDVEDSLTAVAQVKDLEQADTVAADSAQRAARLTAVQFQLGTADFLTVLTVERTLYQAEDALLQVRLQRLQAAVGLFRAMGGGFDAEPTDTANADIGTTAAN
jgi:NodT family efflux transporter outer membrane factor (OMF) lipoprotein